MDKRVTPELYEEIVVLLKLSVIEVANLDDPKFRELRATLCELTTISQLRDLIKINRDLLAPRLLDEILDGLVGWLDEGKDDE